MSIYSEVKAFLEEYRRSQPTKGRIGEGRPIVVAVSGGPDSVTLLHLVARRGLYRPVDIVVAHLNHQLRPSAERDAQHVAELAAEWGLAYERGEIDVARIARVTGLGIEEAGREARYEFLGSVAEKVGAAVIFTGHTADDQAETILMHLLRGTGTEGLIGMRAIGPVPMSPDLTLLRPLLGVRRSDILDYCRRFSLDPVQDPTNIDVAYFRNRIRHELLPDLREYNPDIEERLLDLASVLASDLEVVQAELDKVWRRALIGQDEDSLTLDLEVWRSSPLGLRRRILRQACSSLQPEGTETSFAAVELARHTAEGGQTGAKVHLPGGVLMRVSYGQLKFEARGRERVADDFPQLANMETIRLPVPGRLALRNSWVIETALLGEIDYEIVRANPDPWTAYLSVQDPAGLYVRPRRPGDHLHPLGMGGRSKKVSDVMIDKKIPEAYRNGWPLVVTSERIAWIVGGPSDEGAKVRPDSVQVIQLIVRRAHD